MFNLRHGVGVTCTLGFNNSAIPGVTLLISAAFVDFITVTEIGKKLNTRHLPNGKTCVANAFKAIKEKFILLAKLIVLIKLIHEIEKLPKLVLAVLNHEKELILLIRILD